MKAKKDFSQKYPFITSFLLIALGYSYLITIAYFFKYLGY